MRPNCEEMRPKNRAKPLSAAAEGAASNQFNSIQFDEERLACSVWLSVQRTGACCAGWNAAPPQKRKVSLWMNIPCNLPCARFWAKK